MFSKLLALALALGSVAASPAPELDGFNIVWQDDFYGPAGSLCDQTKWNIAQSANNANNEWEEYTNSNQNHQLSGGSTLQIVPQLEYGHWTSARLESKYVLTPTDGRVTLLTADIRFGGNPAYQKQGMWPAFWLLGDSIRTGGAGWPGCGEIDILEMVDGRLTGYGTVHCHVAPGGICNEYNGIGGNTPVSDYNWHNWMVAIDRRPESWVDQTITWFLDGNQFFQISGGRINDQYVWSSLAQSPLYFILNVAVGGSFPGDPNSQTTGGFGNDMEVSYVAHYESVEGLDISLGLGIGVGIL
ncbi:putative endo-1,3(4)-beta-glucanase [Xylaria nigripes]|nr:putative endo-1,3(4)-beta-glucanase [Xylaria nigripes]